MIDSLRKQLGMIEKCVLTLFPDRIESDHDPANTALVLLREYDLVRKHEPEKETLARIQRDIMHYTRAYFRYANRLIYQTDLSESQVEGLLTNMNNLETKLLALTAKKENINAGRTG